VQLLNLADDVVQPAKQFTQHFKLLSIFRSKPLALNICVFGIFIETSQVRAGIILLLVNDV
jgi:hypothetical protein